MPGLRTVPQASPRGFEPPISCVTGRRALRAAPRGQECFSSSGGTRTHSIPATNPSGRCPSHGGLPIAYRAAFWLFLKCPGPESNPQPPGDQRCASVPEPSRSAIGVPGRHRSSPGWTRTTDRHLVRVLPSLLGHRTVKRKPRDSNPQTSKDAACLPSRFLIQPDALPAATAPDRAMVGHPRMSGSSGRRIRTSTACDQRCASVPEPGSLPLADPRIRVPCGSRTRLASLEGWNLCRSAKGT